MRPSRYLVAAAACVIAAVAAVPSYADEMDEPRAHAAKRVPKRVVGSYVHVFNRYGNPALSADPYAYSYEPKPWYPSYNSGQWVPRAYMRYRTRYDFALPAYYSSWGYPNPCGRKSAHLCGNPGDRLWW